MTREHRRVRPRFDALCASRSATPATEREQTMAAEWQRRLQGQISVHLTSISVAAQQLDSLVHRELLRQQRLVYGAVALGLVTLALSVALLSLLTARRIIRPLQALHHGIRVVGSGNLTHRVGTEARDEIGVLSRAFDEMTDSLRQVIASRDDLNREVNERQRAEARLREALAELERSNKELELFAYVASHDLQEPLRTVSSFATLLARRYRERLDQDATEFIDFITGGAHRAQALINDLLQYSRVGTRAKPFAPVDCEALLGQVLSTLAVAVNDAGACITHDPLPVVSGDETQLAQLVQNLIGNALKFRRPDTTPLIHLSARRDGDGWLFQVRDNGIGIAPEYRERVFIIFQRLHGDRYPGTGLGLAICRKIVERHGGRIWVEGAPDPGTVFCFTLHSAPPAAPDPQATAGAPPP